MMLIQEKPQPHVKKIGINYIFLWQLEFYFWDYNTIVFLSYLFSLKPSYVPLLVVLQIHGFLLHRFLLHVHMYIYTQILKTGDTVQCSIACLVYEKPRIPTSTANQEQKKKIKIKEGKQTRHLTKCFGRKYEIMHMNI